jgi:PilZ domain
MGQSAATLSAKDRRAAERIATSLRGKVFAGAAPASPIDCVIADFNKLGARLRFDGPPPEGVRMTMVVWSSGFAFDATVRWRRGLSRSRRCGCSAVPASAAAP